MTTASTSSVFSQAASGSPAGIDAWSGELCGELIACGLLQTNDTGQLAITGTGGTATTNAAQPTGVGSGNTVGYVCFTFTDPKAGGTLSTTALNSGGTGYDGGSTHTYTGVTATGATSGATCTCSVTVTSGVCGNMSSIASSGNFIAGEKITIPVAQLGNNGGSGANWTATALSSGAPVVFRLDFGADSIVTDPMFYITLGTGSSGAGVINGSAGTTRMTQVACGAGGAPLSTVTAYTSYYCYNNTLGTCLAAMKFGGITANCYALAFYIHRSNDSTGAPSGASVSLYTNSNSTTAATTNYKSGCQQTMPYSAGVSSGTIYPTISTVGNGNQWAAIPTYAGTSFAGGITSTLENSTIFLFNVLYFNPAWSYSAFMAVCLQTDVANGVSVSTTLIGTQSVTLLSLEYMFGISGSPFQVAGLNIMCVYQ